MLHDWYNSDNLQHNNRKTAMMKTTVLGPCREPVAGENRRETKPFHFRSCEGPYPLSNDRVAGVSPAIWVATRNLPSHDRWVGGIFYFSPCAHRSIRANIVFYSNFILRYGNGRLFFPRLWRGKKQNNFLIISEIAINIRMEDNICWISNCCGQTPRS